MIRRSPRALKRRKSVLELDRLAREVVFRRDHHRCVRCGSEAIQWCHVEGRRTHALRWHPDNALTLCGGCHLWFDHHRLPSMAWFRERWPEREAFLLSVLNGPERKPPAHDDVRAELAALLGVA